MSPYSFPGASPVPYPAPYGASDGSAPGHPGGPLTVSDAVVDLLHQTRPWVKTISVFAFVGSALMLAIGLFAVGAGLLVAGARVQAALGLVYIPVAVAYVYPGVKLWAFAAAIERLVASRSTADLEDALGQQKSFWRFSGIATIVLAVVYVGIFVAAIAIGVVVGLHRGIVT